MPLYEYKCTKCGRRTEKIENVSGPHLKKCPHCGGKVESLISAPAIQFKGSGWYVTDYAGKRSTSTEGEKTEKPATESKDGDTKTTETPAKDSTTKDKKPAKKDKGK